MLKRICAIALGVGCLCAAGPFDKGDIAEEAKRWWSHVQVLADDKMKGRNTGSPEHKMAAAYVANQFEKAGLSPGGSASSYRQPVPFEMLQIDETKSSLALLAAGQSKPEALNLGEHAYLGVSSDPNTLIEAEMVFVGYGMQVPEIGYDDFKGLDLKGKVAVIVSGQPAGIPGELASHYQSRAERAKVWRAVGAIGVANIPNPKNSDIPWARVSQSRLMPSMALVDKDKPEDGGSRVRLTINAVHANKFLAGSGHTIEEILGLADEKKALPHFALAQRLQVKTGLTRSQVESENTIGIHWGSDPKLRNEFIIFSAHLDHVGVNEKSIEDKIYNGAMDNASGVASLIEAARHLRESKLSTKRSIAFVAVTGEEKGLLGSDWFARHPVFGKLPQGKIVADLNMDMFLPLYPLKSLQILGMEESTLGDLARKTVQDAGIEVVPDPSPERNIFIRSDQYSFIRTGVPSVYLTFGYTKGSPEEKIVKTWLRDRYHSPYDDLDQPVDKEAAAHYNRLLASLAVSAANMDEHPAGRTRVSSRDSRQSK
jgi:Zn-dependent M28 family amino/carboxypeptidase